VGQAAFPVNHESIPLLHLLVALYFEADQTIMRVERTVPLLLTFPSHPFLQIILCTICNILLPKFSTPVNPPKKIQKYLFKP
jgi:hypothetical protein